MKCRALLLLVLILGLESVSHAAPLQKVAVRNAANRQAVCNDGSPGVYYSRPGAGTGVNRWVIFLAGGGFCFSFDTCEFRSVLNPELMTSADKPPTIQVDGLLSDMKAQNPDFYNANHVVVVYCSSDLWSGSREKSDAAGGFEFRGWNIVRAVIADLKQQQTGPNLKTATEVLLAGTSAGGAGVMVHLDWVAAQLPRAKVRGLNDAGWLPESNALPLGEPVRETVAKAVQYWNGKPDPSCVAANPGRKDRCYLSSVYPYLKTPLFVQESQWDSWALGLAGIDYPFDLTEQVAADAFAVAVRQSLVPVAAAFSPRLYVHGLAPYKRFNAVKVDNVNLRRALGNFFFDRPGPTKVVK
jgi:hypothetical protein